MASAPSSGQITLFGHPSLRALKQKSVRWFARDGPLRRDYDGFRSFAKEASLIFAYIYAGWNDATAGSLLPAIQERYNLSFSVVSLLFVANLVGWIAAAAITPELIKKFTFGRTITLTTAVAIIPALIIAAGSPFPVMACAYALFGLSVGSMDAICNAWVAARPNARVRLGILHFAYGVGALCAPLAGTPFVVSGIDFHYFYFGSLGLSVLNTAFVTACFRLKREGYPDEVIEQQQRDSSAAAQKNTSSSVQEQANDIELRSRRSGDLHSDPDGIEVASERQSQPTTPATSTQGMLSATDAPTVAPDGHPTTSSQWKTLMRQRDTHVFAVFCLFYVGTEVAIGGWTSTFIIRVRGEVDASGHIVSGFWAGLAAGRVFLIPVTDLLGPQLATFVYLSLSVALQFVNWFVPSYIASGVAVGIMGLLLGPIFPIMIELISKRIIPRSAQTLAIAYIVAFGSAGSALFPLIVGFIIQSHGAESLAPTLLAFLIAQGGIFLLLGKPNKQGGEATRAVD